MKHLKRVFLLFVLFFIFIYVVSIDNIPQTIEIFQGEEINIPTLWGIKISNEDESIETSSTLYSSTFNEIGEEKLEVSLFDKIRLKTINVNVIEDVDVIPVGEIVGIKLYTNGVMVVGMASIEGEDGNIYKPYQDTGIQEGDCITYVNGTEIASTEDLTEEINKSLGNEIELTFNHKEETRTGKIKSVKNKDGKYTEGKITVTYYYTKNDGTVEEPKVEKTGPNTINSIDGVFNYTISGSAKIKDYVGSTKLIVKDMLPYTIDINKSKLPSTCTYDGNKTITCIKEYNNITEEDYINGVFEVNASFNLELVFIGIDSDKIINKGDVGEVVSVDGKMLHVKLNSKTQAFDGNWKQIAKPNETVFMFSDHNHVELGDKVVIQDEKLCLKKDKSNLKCDIILCSL